VIGLGNGGISDIFNDLLGINLDNPEVCNISTMTCDLSKDPTVLKNITATCIVGKVIQSDLKICEVDLIDPETEEGPGGDIQVKNLPMCVSTSCPDGLILEQFLADGALQTLLEGIEGGNQVKEFIPTSLLMGECSTEVSPSFVSQLPLLPSSSSLSAPSTMTDYWSSVPIDILEGHTSWVWSLQFSPKERWLASAGSDNAIILWDLAGGAEVTKIPLAHISTITSLEFSPDGTKLVSGSKDNTLKVWNVGIDGALSLNNTLSGHTALVYAVKFSHDGKYVASGGYDDTIRIWNVTDGGMLQTLTGHTGYIYSLAFAPNGNLLGNILASGSHDNSIRIWNLDNGTEISSATGHISAVISVDFSHDGSQLASGSRDNSIKIWNLTNFKLVPDQNITEHTNWVHSVKFSPDGKYLASGSWDTTVKLWERNNDYSLAKTFYGHTSHINSIDFSLDGQKIASGSWDKTIRIWATTCGPGYYGSHQNCTKCANGTYADKADMNSCMPCAPGTVQKYEGATDCKTCSAGTYQPLEGKTQCEECRAGGYCDSTKAGTCDGGFTPCPPGMFSNTTGEFEESCVPCPPGTFSNSTTGIEACFECHHLLGSEENSTKCPFCANKYYLNVPNVPYENLIENPANFCLPCPDNAICNRNTTIETIEGIAGFWRDSNQTEEFYKCSNITEICLGGTSCAKGYSGVLCEVCKDKNEYFNSSEGECTECPQFARLGYFGIAVGVFCILFFIAKNNMHRYARIRCFFARAYCISTIIGLQAKIKILVSFYQVVVTIQPIYGVRMHNDFTWWFSIFNVLNFGLAETFGIPDICFGQMKERLLISAGWPFALAIFLVSGIFVYTIVINMRRIKRKELFVRFLSLSLHGVIIIFYLVLPSVSRKIFDARTCRSFYSNDSKNELNSYLIADWSIKCEKGTEEYESITKVFWALFAIWPVTVPILALGLLLYIRSSVRSDSITHLAQACQFLWFDYDRRMMFWEVLDMIRKISLTGLIIFVDTEEGADKILRLVIATGICIVYGTILSHARPYKRKDNLQLAILSNMLLTCCFLVGIIIHQCKEGEDDNCKKLFGLSNSYQATSISYQATLLAVILTAAMLILFVLSIFIQSVNEIKTHIVRLISTNDKPNMSLPGECKYHFFMSHTWASGQDKVHKIARMLNLYVREVKIWLDVDQLENLNNLEDEVVKCAHFILFYSKDVFNSVNCRREILMAMEADKPITVLYEANDYPGDIVFMMKEKLRESSQGDPNATKMMSYIFAEEPIMWISDGIQFSFESIKLITGRLLKSLPFYKRNPGLLTRGLNIVSIIKPTEVLSPLYILYCDMNDRACHLAETLAQECNTNVQASKINLMKSYEQYDNEEYVMLVYLNKDAFRVDGDMLHQSVKYAMDHHINLVLVHERDGQRGGCAFREIVAQTPEYLKKAPYNIYSEDIAVSLYTTKEYDYISLCQLLSRVGVNT